VLRVGCAAAVTGNEELAACTQRSFDGVRDRGDQTAKLTILRRFLQGGERPVAFVPGLSSLG